MEIKHIQRNEKGAFQAWDEETPAGVLEYEITTSEVLSALHTEAYAGYEGQGVAGKLFQALVDFVREKELRIRPLCPYVKARLEKDQTLHDLIAS